jgi:pimeloyl-ACP methyl ester carboxylesterase
VSNPPLEGRYVEVWGRRAHYHLSGHGPKVLLLHGNGSLGEEILSSFHHCQEVTWIAPDRPGYGFSEPLAKGEDPDAVASWALALMDALELGQVTLVAHSIAAGAALCLAGAAPQRIGKLVLLAPFCRPTPHRWMLGLRIAVAPVVGRPVRRYLLPALLPLFRRNILEGMLHPNPVPPWLKRFPVEHAARGPSLRTMAAELRRFNRGMLKRSRSLRIEVPTTAIFGSADRTAPPGWHEPWLRRHVASLEAIRLEGVGHAVHHADPAAALRAVLEG